MDAAVAGKSVQPVEGVSKKIQLGVEDVILGMALLVLTVGYLRGQLTIQDFLSYLGVSGAGGLWGML
jgi:hypothetical protein